jgi:DNA-binding CsgD family transcriptional regulator
MRFDEPRGAIWCARVVGIERALLEAVDAIYAASLDESLWPDTLRRVLELTDSQAISFCIIDRSGEPRMPVFDFLNLESRSVDMPLFMAEYLEGGMAAIDPTIRYIVANPHASLVRDSALMSEAEKDRDRYYAWHAHHSDLRHRAAALSAVSKDIQVGLTIHRTRQKGDFPDNVEPLFTLLRSHMERAVRIAFQLGTLETMLGSSREILDRNHRGIILLDDRGAVVFANAAAEAIARSDDGVLLSKEGVRFKLARDNAMLQRMIRNAVAKNASVLVQNGGVMRALRPSGNDPYLVTVSPVSAGAFLFTVARPAVCIVISDPELVAAPAYGTLKELFGLTPSEARLALLLAKGLSLQAAAARAGVAYATARAQLTMVFRKTRTSRQSELVKLLVSDMPGTRI